MASRDSCSLAWPGFCFGFKAAIERRPWRAAANVRLEREGCYQRRLMKGLCGETFEKLSILRSSNRYLG